MANTTGRTTCQNSMEKNLSQFFPLLNQFVWALGVQKYNLFKININIAKYRFSYHTFFLNDLYLQKQLDFCQSS